MNRRSILCWGCDTGMAKMARNLGGSMGQDKETHYSVIHSAAVLRLSVNQLAPQRIQI